MAGEGYLFKPVASDSDGDKLTFSIANRPVWAAFDAGTGRLSGTPGAAYVGNYDNVRISVSDGRGGSSALPAFGIAVMQSSNGVVTVSWTPPVRNTDGSALTNLAGYRIHYGRQPGGPYATTINVSNPAVSTYVVENLTAGTYYFVVTARNGADAESELSNEAIKTLN